MALKVNGIRFLGEVEAATIRTPFGTSLGHKTSRIAFPGFDQHTHWIAAKTSRVFFLTPM